MTALILQSSENKQHYFCGGVIISNHKILTGNQALSVTHKKNKRTNFIVFLMTSYINKTFIYSFHTSTAAHCIHNKERFLFPNDILIAMGVHDIEKKFEPHRVVMEVNEFFIHPDWDPFNQNYDSDIAVIKTTHQIQFNDFIQPICLWELQHNIPATSGIAVGYGVGGRTANTSKGKRVATKLQIFIHQNDECTSVEPKLHPLTSNRTLCGESPYGSTICQGDSGHGYFVKFDNKFYLRGIISSSPKGMNSSCTFTNYGVYTNVLMYKEWIDSPKKYYSRNMDTCGVMSSAVGLIQGGSISLRDQFPWTALIKYSASQHTGVLISQKHVLSHSGSVGFWKESDKRFIVNGLNALKVHFGVIDVTNLDDPNVISVNPQRIIIHPHLRKEGSTVINAVAIISLETSVPFNKFIKPICLWRNQQYFNKEMSMYSFGYGKDDTGKFSKNRKFSKMSYTSQKVCREIYTDRLTAFEYSKLFCAQGDEHQTPCDGDTPLIMKFNDRWFIRGIMLTFRFWNSNGTCVHNRPLLYEDIAAHSHWILSQTIH